MKKIFFVIFTLLLAKPVFAGSNITVVCSSGGCSKSTDLPLFNEVNIAPGDKFSQFITVQNNRSGDCQLKTTATDDHPSILSDRIFLDITGSNSSSYADTLSQFYSNPNRPLGIISVGSTTVYAWKSEFDSEAGNEYQNLSSIFDLDLNFTCDEPSTSIPTTPPSNNNPPPTCNKTPPTATDIYKAEKNPDGSVLLRWHNVTAPFTHYLIAFGPNRTTFLYGAPNVGNDNKYLVKDLTPGARYCFYVKAVNDCAPGPISNIHCINEEAAPGTAIPEGFNPGVLGEQTTATPGVESGSILGENLECVRKWLPILFVLAFLINLIIFNPVLSFVLCALCFFIDWYLLQSHCCLINPIFCQYFWVGNILSYLLPFVFKIRQK
jgi:hypothetical protein